MADIRCSHCGKDNPDFFDVCQFCQSPLTPDAMLHIGEEPVKKDTGELEEILPEWLKDARQRGKNDEAADDAFRSQTKPKVQEEPPDLLAGLMSQAESDEDEVPDWLAGIRPAAEERPSPPAPSPVDEKGPPGTAASEPSPEDIPAWMGMEEKPSGQMDELADWFSQTASEAGGTSSDDAGRMTAIGSFESSSEPSSEKEPEDLSWLRDLEAASKGTDETSAPPKDAGFDFGAASSGEDLDWLSELGGAPAPKFEEPAPAQSASSAEDLNWLNELGGSSIPAFEQSTPSQPVSSSEDLDWLKTLEEASAPAFEEAAQSPSSVSAQEDMDWLKDLDSTSELPEKTASAFAEEPEVNVPPSSKPFQTAPLNELLNDEEIKDTAPDWLKNAMEEPSMPPPGAVTMGWFADKDRTTAPGVPTQTGPASSQQAFDFPAGDSSTTPDLDSLFNVEMPDWLTRETEQTETPQPETPTAFVDGSLAPVELPSWVQAMRPVDSAISDATASSVDQITEREGPLAGFRGVIPSAPIGSSLRPKAFSLKLQITEEQQTSATLLEQIIAGEATVHARKSRAGVSTQKVMRWVLSGLFLIVLSVVLGLGLKTMPISASATVNELSNLVAAIPEGSPVLVVVDYEPAFSGELEATAGPLLDQLALSRRSTFTFVSMSPNGSALADRLMVNTGIGGLGYQPGAQYFNLGFLPGGSSGVSGFINNPTDGNFDYEAFVLMTDTAETGRVWVEQLEAAGPEVAGKPLFMVASAQAGPMLQPYVSSGQADIMINGLYDAAKYEFVNNTRPGIARSYWDAFGVGLMMAVVAIVLGSVWSVFMQIRERRAEGEQG